MINAINGDSQVKFEQVDNSFQYSSRVQLNVADSLESSSFVPNLFHNITHFIHSVFRNLFHCCGLFDLLLGSDDIEGSETFELNLRKWNFTPELREANESEQELLEDLLELKRLSENDVHLDLTLNRHLKTSSKILTQFLQEYIDANRTDRQAQRNLIYHYESDFQSLSDLDAKTELSKEVENCSSEILKLQWDKLSISFANYLRAELNT